MPPVSQRKDPRGGVPPCPHLGHMPLLVPSPPAHGHVPPTRDGGHGRRARPLAHMPPPGAHAQKRGEGAWSQAGPAHGCGRLWATSGEILPRRGSGSRRARPLSGASGPWRRAPLGHVGGPLSGAVYGTTSGAGHPEAGRSVESDALGPRRGEHPAGGRSMEGRAHGGGGLMGPRRGEIPAGGRAHRGRGSWGTSGEIPSGGTVRGV